MGELALTAATEIYLEKKVAQICTYHRCKSEPSEGAMLCERHLLRQRKRDARYRRLLRRSRRQAGLCSVCELPSAAYRCIPCRIRLRLVSSKSVHNGVDKSSADKNARIAAVTKRHEDGRTRYHGQARRGNQPHEQLDAQDRDAAARSMDEGFSRLGMYRTPAVQALPMIQRKSVRLQACQQIDHGIAFLEAVLVRNGFTRPSREGLEGDDE